MISSELLTKLLSAEDEETIERLLNYVSEEDAKVMLRVLIHDWNKRRKDAEQAK